MSTCQFSHDPRNIHMHAVHKVLDCLKERLFSFLFILRLVHLIYEVLLIVTGDHAKTPTGLSQVIACSLMILWFHGSPRNMIPFLVVQSRQSLYG